jgi:predicted unusual protein kinase regulating ubiquinone biosynthesis (AarF/ABC1/UbiB family)
MPIPEPELQDNPKVKAPKIYWEYSGTQLLTMEYIDGVRMTISQQ